MKKGVDLIYKLNGDFDEGIDVFELSPILLSVGRLINEAHKSLFPEDREIAINIRPFQKGSYEINILLFAKDILDRFLDFAKSDTGQNISLVLAYLGYTSQFSGINLIQLISLLKGKLKSVEPLKSGEVRYHSDDNTSYTVVKQVHTLYQNCNIQQNIYNSIGRPLELPDVDSAESFVKNDEDNTKIIYKKDITQPIKAYSSGLMSADLEDKPVENKLTMWVHPKRGSFEGEKHKWSFRIGKDNIITANISDENFLEKIKDGRIRLYKDDKLFVEILQRQTVKETEVKTSYEIIKVLNYIKGPEHEEFKFD